MNSPDVKPFMYQDLMSGSNSLLPPLGMPVGMYPTNFLGTVHLQPQPDGDKFLRMQEKDRSERNAFLVSLAALAVIGTSAALLFKGKMDFKGLLSSITSPFKSAGKAVNSGCSATGSVISDAGKKSKNGLKSLGSTIGKGFKKVGGLIILPFVLLGKGLKNLGKAIASPFKSLKNRLSKIFKRKPKSEPVQIKGILEPPKNTGGATTSAANTGEILTPDRIIMPDGSVVQ